MAYTVKLSPELCQFILKKSNGVDVLRAFNMWHLLAVQGGLSWYPYDWVVETFSEEIGLSPTSVKRHIKAGIELGLFESAIVKGDPALFVTGRRKVYLNYLDEGLPGKIIYVESHELLTKSYKNLRTLYHNTFCAAKPKTRSRAFQAKQTGFTEQTITNWTRAGIDNGNLVVKANYYVATMPYSGQEQIIKRAPNTYINPGVYKVRTDNPKQAWEDNSTRGYIPTKRPDNKNMRRYFPIKEQSDAAMAHRIRKHNRDEHFVVVDTFWEGKLGNKHVFRRSRPYTIAEIPVDLLIADEQQYDAETHKWELEQDAAHQQFVEQRVAANEQREKQQQLQFAALCNKLDEVNTVKLRKPRKNHHRNVSYKPLSELTESQQIELLIRPELAVLLD